MESTVIKQLLPMSAAVCRVFVSTHAFRGSWQQAAVCLQAAASKINSFGINSFRVVSLNVVPTGADHRGRTAGDTPPRSGPPRSSV